VNPAGIFMAVIFVALFAALILAGVAASALRFSGRFQDLLIEEKKKKKEAERRASTLIEPGPS